MNKIIATNTKGDGILPMKQSPELEGEKSTSQKDEELCNFIKNAFVIDGVVTLVLTDKPFTTKLWFLAEDTKRGKIAIAYKPVEDNLDL